MIGYLKNNIYENIYGSPIKCFKCGENKCNGTKSFALQFGGDSELVHCEKHEIDAKIKVSEINGNVSDVNIKISCT
tara:strand:- start:49 stop:276 length:228 start_codon:yes stop_codon:yes gene_type:complete